MNDIALNQVCYRTLQFDEPWTFENYKKVGGYSVLEKIFKDKQPAEEIVEALKISALRGRGGAGFPAGMKWSFINRNAPGQKYVLCNGDESEPGTCKDRDIIRFNPHQIIEGMIIGGYVMGATMGYHYMRGEFGGEPFERFEQALIEAREAGYLGDNILNSGVDFQLHGLLGAGAYICGEETALMQSVEGKQGRPRFKPPFPANFGVYGRPTTINNVETFASVPVILEKGAEWFLNIGIPNNGGTKIFSVSGDVEKPGNYEIPLGTPFKDLLELAGGMRGGAKLKAVIPGGSSMPVLPAEVMMQTNMDFDSLSKAGSALGSGAVIVMDEHTNIVKMARCLSHFYMEESCGQCTPCREGTGWMYRILKRIEEGEGKLEDLDKLQSVADNIENNTICAFGPGAAWPVQGFLRHFREDFEHLIKHKTPLVA
jgi:NADH-quinone oxidoreductase subunit F